jgi:hypothetical protein
LRALTHNTTLAHSQTYPKAPHKTQRSPLSPLQRLVKEARVSILEPVLGLGLAAPRTGSGLGSGVSTPGDITAEVNGRDIDGGKDGLGERNTDVKGGKKKKGGLTVVLPPLSQLQLRTRSSNGVFLPTPSSSSTTSSTSTVQPRTRRLTATGTTGAGRHSRASTIDLNTTSLSFSFASPTSTPTPPPYPPQTTAETQTTYAKSTRTRRPSAKFSQGDFVDSTTTRKKRSSTIINDWKDVMMEPPTSTSSTMGGITETLQPIKLGKRTRRASSPPTFQPPPPDPPDNNNNNTATRRKVKIKPETYRQAWSVSEQHLLERLLDEIPEGEKNRCVCFL